MTTIELADDLIHPEPVGYLVYADRDCTESELFAYLDEAQDAAQSYAEAEWEEDDGEEGEEERVTSGPKPWPVYALWPTELEAKPEERE
jgi:hypothetical protein